MRRKAQEKMKSGESRLIALLLQSIQWMGVWWTTELTGRRRGRAGCKETTPTNARRVSTAQQRPVHSKLARRNNIRRSPRSLRAVRRVSQSASWRADARHAGLLEIRTIPAKKDIAFVEFADEATATVAKDALHNFKIDGETKMKVSSRVLERGGAGAGADDRSRMRGSRLYQVWFRIMQHVCVSPSVIDGDSRRSRRA